MTARRIAALHLLRRWGAAPWLIAVAMMAWPMQAFAYRPFDGTDAAVADVGEVEIELQPAGVLHGPSQTTLIAPATVINYGFAKDWEAIVQGQVETPLSPGGPSSITQAGAFLKHVLLPGVLQDKSGPSVATEFGILFPDSIGSSGFGASVAGIVSQRWDWGTVHFNAAATLTRDHHGDVFVGSILEGPSKWTVRPVAEIFYEEEFGQSHTVSGLIGAIWQVRDNLSFDIGVRHGWTDDHPFSELRAGMTFGFALRPAKDLDRSKMR
jgi:hypothetical protein